jgi:polysaccharide export outer membrane protein
MMRKNCDRIDRPQARVSQFFIVFASLLGGVAVLYAQPAQRPAGPETSASPLPGQRLPAQKLGGGDLISIEVYNAPEFTRVVRVRPDGSIEMPLLDATIQAEGLLPSEVEGKIAEALREQKLLLKPLVTVSVVEYASRPISVIGSVKNSITFQAVGRVTLLDAITRAGGLTPEAGPEILVSWRKPDAEAELGSLVRRVPTKELVSEPGSGADMILTGGEVVRVPEMGKVFVFGNVKAPGAYAVRDNSDTTVMKAIALAGGMAASTANEVYVIRRDDTTGAKHEIPIELKSILERKAPDFPVQPDDILYIPENKRRRVAVAAIDRILTFGAAVGAGVLVVTAGR